MIGCYTLFKKEMARFGKVWFQTVLSPIVTAMLYLMVFSQVLEGRVEVFDGISYTEFLIPGLLMMTVIQNAFANSSSSLIQSKTLGNLLFILVAPISTLQIFLAYTAAAVARGLIVGLGVLLIALLYVEVPVYNFGIIMLFAISSSAVLGALGIIAGIWADKFDQMAAFQNFIIVPLSFLSGVFYSIHSLSGIWQTLSHFNPFLYMIDGFRYGFFGTSDVPVGTSFAVVIVSLTVLSAICYRIIDTGYKLRQ
ncbi:MAG: ABC transporter permease [Arenicellaceae bacterium]|nr:ABC transporter permease [Arenicellaceae bacterium]